MAALERRQVIHQLAQKMRIGEGEAPAEQQGESASHLKISGYGNDGTPSEVFSTGIDPLDELLPARGVSPGTLIEWLADGPGSGAGTLALAAADGLMQRKECVVVDRQETFYPPQQGPLSGFLERMIVVHPKSERDALWAAEQSLRCSGVAVVLCRFDAIHDHTYRRLQLAAETGKAIGLLLRPARFASQPSWADVRLRVSSLPFEGEAFSPTRWLRVELLHCRGRVCGRAAELEIDDETGDVRLVSRVAVAADAARAARA